MPVQCFLEVSVVVIRNDCYLKGELMTKKIEKDLENDDLTPVTGASPDITLPDPELSNLKEIATILSNAHTLNEKDKLSAYIISEVRYRDSMICRHIGNASNVFIDLLRQIVSAVGNIGGLGRYRRFELLV